MNQTVYLVMGHTTEPPCEAWVVMIHADEEAAREHSKKAAAEAKRIRSNIKRATMLRGKPFSQAELERFASNSKFDPAMRLAASSLTYEVLEAPLAEGLISDCNEMPRRS
jgi:hypothetical protein